MKLAKVSREPPQSKMNLRPDVQSKQCVENKGENDVQLQRPAKPAFEQLVRADGIFEVGHGFGEASDLTGWAAG